MYKLLRVGVKREALLLSSQSPKKLRGKETLLPSSQPRERLKGKGEWCIRKLDELEEWPLFRKIVFTSQNYPCLYKDLQLNSKTLLINIQTSGLTFLHRKKDSQ